MWKKLLSSLKQPPEFIKSQSFVQDKRISNLGQKDLIWILLGSNFENFFRYLKAAPSSTKFCAKKKKKKILRTWHQKCLIWVKILKFKTKSAKIRIFKFGIENVLFRFFLCNFGKLLSKLFEVTTLKFVKMQRLVQNKNS